MHKTWMYVHGLSVNASSQVTNVHQGRQGDLVVSLALPRQGLTIRESTLMCECHDMHKTEMYVHGSRSSVTASSQVTEVHHDRVASSYRWPVFWSVAEGLELRGAAILHDRLPSTHPAHSSLLSPLPIRLPFDGNIRWVCYAIDHLETLAYDPVNLRSSNSKAKCEPMINIDNVIPALPHGEKKEFRRRDILVTAVFRKISGANTKESQ